MYIRKKQRWRMILFLAALICILTGLSARSVRADSKPLDAERKVIRVAFPKQPGMSEVDEYGNLSGYTYEYLGRLAQFTGWEYEFITFPELDDDEALMKSLKMVAAGQADLVGGMLYSEDLAGQYTYAEQSYGVVYTTLSALEENPDMNETTFMLHQPLRIAVLEQAQTRRQELSEQMRAFKLNYEEILCQDAEEQYRALLDDRADALLRVSLSYVPGTQQISQFAPRPYYLVMTKGNTELERQVNEALLLVSENYPYLQSKLFQKYFGDSSGNFTISDKDRAFLRENGTIRALYLTQDAPYSMEVDGAPAGLMVSLLNDFARDVGIDVSYTPIDTIDDVEKMVRQEHDYDCVLGALFGINDNARYGIITTNTIVNTDMLQFSRRSTPAKPLEESVIAVRKGYGVDQYLAGAGRIRYYDNVEDCVLAVNRGECDYGFGDNYCVEYAMEKYACNLTTIPFYGHELEAQLSMLNTGRLEYLSLLNRYINNLSDATRHTYMTDAKSTLVVGSLTYFVETNPIAVAALAGLFLVLMAASIILLVFTQKLRKSNAQLSVASSAKSDFLSRISHDMRTPLNGILGLTYLMQERVESEQNRADLEQMEISGKYLLNLINDTLDVSKIEHGHLELHPSVCDGKKVIENTLALLKPNLEEKQIQLKLQLEPLPSDALYMDAGRVEQLIVNILGNAVKFTPPHGSIVFSMKTLAVDDGVIVEQITVRDNGIGMSEAFLPHLFEPFSQEHHANTGNLQGTGLGMAISRQIIELMGGTIRVNSKEGEGTEFVITLKFPIETQKQAKAICDQGSPAEDLTVLQGKRVLLCEDHPLNIQIATRLLVKMGLLVEHAENGKIGVEMFMRSAVGYYDVVLMDIRMPVLDGMGAARQIRAADRPDAGQIPIIATTANAFDEDVEQCKNAGMNDHLGKPIEPEKLYEALVNHLSVQEVSSGTGSGRNAHEGS